MTLEHADVEPARRPSSRVARRRRFQACFSWVLFLVCMPTDLRGASVSLNVRDEDGASIANAVVYAIPDDRDVPPSDGVATMDQYNRAFVPHVLPVQTGTAVSFPNSDNIRHQVYSFSPVKKFQIPLYEGTPAEAIVFDKPGVLSLGCNIHDRMNAFIVVVDTPYFARAERGRAVLDDLAAGTYSVYVWHPRLRGDPEAQVVTVKAQDEVELETPATP